ncbi:NAD(P)/FAD-dependent oxidoreductase [Streptomyces sp. NPDC050560]|uniref:NAD(P)/FAD-dependent oxidoreductase n=1 Tax=Streptomyces sp. NPDC050560 TaxID=3365630 RepID=UPI0037AF7592
MPGEAALDRVGRVVVVGASVGGVRTAQALRSGGFTGELTVIGAEPVEPYDKPPLSKELLTGERSLAEVSLLRPGDREAFDLRLGAPATGLDTRRREVRVEGGGRVPYDALVIATGVRPRTLPGPAAGLVHTVRESSDAETLRRSLATGAPVVVVGGGFVGAEVAAAAVAAGCPTTLIEADSTPFARVLGSRVGALLTALHRRGGVRVRAGVPVAGVTGTPGDLVVTLADGARLAAGTVVVGIGCLPNTEWLAGSGVPLDDGIVTDEYCAVPGLDGVYAIGDVARWYDGRTATHRRVEHWTNAAEQAEAVARDLLRPQRDAQRAPCRAAPYFWSDQHGVKIQMVGVASGDDDVEILSCATRTGERRIALYGRGGRFTAAVTFGWPRAAIACRRAWNQAGTLAEVREQVARLAVSVTPLAPAAPAAPACAPVERVAARAGVPSRTTPEEGRS